MHALYDDPELPVEQLGRLITRLVLGTLLKDGLSFGDTRTFFVAFDPDGVGRADIFTMYIHVLESVKRLSLRSPIFDRVRSIIVRRVEALEKYSRCIE
jgi:hypothetical protein